MLLSSAWLLSCLILPGVLAGEAGCPSPSPSSSSSPTTSNVPVPTLAVNTTSGRFTGFINASTPDVNIWLGIPYATPPIGSLRFRPPLPAANAGDVDATSYRDICYQNSNLQHSLFWLLTTPFQNTDPQSEDCLYLNIWGPRKPVKSEKKVPVIIWVCGGGFNEGGGHAPYQVPDHWIQRTQSHIVVAFNYRMNIFGFPGAKAAPFNVGLMDIRLVVEWVHANIEGFGGDPDRIILWGQSAGGGAVDFYSFANPTEPLVSGLIADSGYWGRNKSNANGDFSTFASYFGCGNLTADEEVACMQKVEPTQFRDVLEAAGASGNSSVPGFGPAVDNVTVFGNYTERLEKGLYAKLPMIAGNNVNEGAAFPAFSLNQTAPPPAATLHQWLDLIACPVSKQIQARAEYGLTTYRYLFAGNFSNITPRYWLGAMHSSELPLVFGTHFEFNGNSTEFEYETSYAMEAFWVSFATDPSANPTDGKGLTWPKYTVNGSMVFFANDSIVDQIVPGDIYDSVYACPATNVVP